MAYYWLITKKRAPRARSLISESARPDVSAVKKLFAGTLSEGFYAFNRHLSEASVSERRNASESPANCLFVRCTLRPCASEWLHNWRLLSYTAAMRIAAVSFANAEPLVRGLPWPVDRLLPSDMSADVVNQYDLILAPIALSAKEPTWRICDDAPMIGCHGDVGSVRVDFVPGASLENAEHIAYSPHSQSANALLRTLVQHHWQVADRIELMPAELAAQCDGRLIIGDHALATSPSASSLDLGGAWHEWTNLPFVFAAWMSQTPLTEADKNHLRSCCAHNLERVTQTFGAHAHTPALLHHFTTQLCYEYGAPQCEAINKFLQYIAND